MALAALTGAGWVSGPMAARVVLFALVVLAVGFGLGIYVARGEVGQPRQSTRSAEPTDLPRAGRPASLRGANLQNAKLTSADLRHADLRGADLSGANMAGADLSGADLTPLGEDTPDE